jgi:hypothetical protein
MIKPARSAFSALAIASTVLVVVATPIQAQTVTAELETRAREACIQKAEADGFTLQDVVSVAPVDADTVNVVLNLNRDGQLFKLTCGFSASRGVATVGDDVGTTAAVRTYQPWLNPWLGVLLPLLLGLPLLWAWTKGRGNTSYVGRETAAVRYGERTEAIVRTNGERLDVHAGPGNSHRVTGNLRNGQRIVLSGRYDNNWVELLEGGWVPAEYLDTNPRYVS